MVGKRYTTFALLLMLGCLIVLSLIILQWQNPPRLRRSQELVRSVPLLVDTPASDASIGFTLAPLSQYSEIIERPLFLPSRRPIAASESSEESESVEDSDFTLLGVAITPERMLALLQIDKAGKVVRLNVGEEVDGWMLETVRKDRVVLRSGDLTEELLLKPKPGKPEAKKPQTAASDSEEVQETQAEASDSRPMESENNFSGPSGVMQQFRRLQQQ